MGSAGAPGISDAQVTGAPTPSGWGPSAAEACARTHAARSLASADERRRRKRVGSRYETNERGARREARGASASRAAAEDEKVIAREAGLFRASERAEWRTVGYRCGSI